MKSGTSIFNGLSWGNLIVGGLYVICLNRQLSIIIDLVATRLMNPTARSVNFDKKISKQKVFVNSTSENCSADSKQDSQPQLNVN